MDQFPVYNKPVFEGKEIEMTNEEVNDIENMNYGKNRGREGGRLKAEDELVN